MSSNGQSIDPISAIKARISSMSELEKQQFENETGFGIQAVNIMSYEAAVEYCKNHNINLSSTSVWVDYYQAKADWNYYHELYIQANSIYQDLKSQKNTAQEQYDERYASAVQENGGEKLTTTEDNTIKRETNYTTETITNARQAELTADNLLAKCFMAVDAQRAALNEGIMGEGFMNYTA